MRAEGRGTRSELPDLLSQLTSLDSFFVRNLTPGEQGTRADSELRNSAMLFQAEALAHTILRILRALAFEARFGIPRNDLDVLALFQMRNLWDLGTGRRLKQFLELRNLSSRNLDQIDFSGIQELLQGRSEWIKLAQRLVRDCLNERGTKTFDEN